MKTLDIILLIGLFGIGVFINPTILIVFILMLFWILLDRK
jgi:hypothetical protein